MHVPDVFPHAHPILHPNRAAGEAVRILGSVSFYLSLASTIRNDRPILADELEAAAEHLANAARLLDPRGGS